MRGPLLAGLSLALAAGLTTYLLPAIAVIALLKLRRGIGNAIVFVLPAILMLTLLTARNWQISQEWILTRADGGINLLQGHHAGAQGSYSTIPGFDGTKREQQATARRIAEAAAGRSLRWNDIDRHFRNQAVAFIADHPLAEIELTLRKFYLLFGDADISHDVSFEYEKSRFLWLRLHAVSFPLLLILTLASLLAKRDSRQGWPMSAIILIGVVLAMNIVFYVTERFRLPAVALLTIPAAFGAHVCWQRARLARIALVCLAAFLTAYQALKPLPAGTKRLGDYNLALSHIAAGDFGGAANLLAPHYNDRRSAPLAHLLAVALMQGGNLDRAQAVVEAAVIRHPLAATLHNDLGVIHLRRRDFGAAEACFQRALELRPWFESAKRNLSLTQNLQ
jgi:hypothetical protein